MNLWVIKDSLFFMILVWAIWQDWKWSSISARFLLAAGILGIGLSVVLKRTILQVALSGGLGICLLAMSRWTEGGIGEGDGWFFLVSGFYMDWRDNLQLFLSGLFLCFAVSLFLVVIKCLKRKRKQVTLPFLPFLLPMGIEMMLDSVRLLL